MSTNPLLKEAVMRKISNFNELEKEAFVRSLAKMLPGAGGGPGALSRAWGGLKNRISQIPENMKHSWDMGRAEAAAANAAKNRSHHLAQMAQATQRTNRMSRQRNLANAQNNFASDVSRIISAQPTETNPKPLRALRSLQVPGSQYESIDLSKKPHPRSTPVDANPMNSVSSSKYVSRPQGASQNIRTAQHELQRAMARNHIPGYGPQAVQGSPSRRQRPPNGAAASGVQSPGSVNTGQVNPTQTQQPPGKNPKWGYTRLNSGAQAQSPTQQAAPAQFNLSSMGMPAMMLGSAMMPAPSQGASYEFGGSNAILGSSPQANFRLNPGAGPVMNFKGPDADGTVLSRR